jgi:DNA replication protein DnaC
MNTALSDALKQLRLSGLAGSLAVRLHEAQANRLAHVEFLELVLQDELAVRRERQVERRIKAAAFREAKTLEDFDWDFNRSVKRKQVFDLAAGQFVRQKRDVLLVGPPGVGKSHLAQAIGLAVVKAGGAVLYRSVFDAVRDLLHDEAFEGHDKVMAKYLTPDLLILDDMGMKQLPKRSGEYLFEIIMRRHQLKSTLMTSNRPLEDWGKLVGDVPAATAILDRLLSEAQIVEITGKSYRLRGKPDKPEPEANGE